MKRILIALAIALGASVASATPVIVSNVSGNASNPGLIANGVSPAEGSVWDDASFNSSWKGLGKVLMLTFNDAYVLQDVVLSVDNNDDYLVQVSMDGSTWAALFTVSRDYGEIGWGMDTMSSDIASTEYVEGIDFLPIVARYARIRAVGGDNAYSVGELSFTGSLYRAPAASVAAVPEPGTLALLAGGLAIAGLRSRKRRG